jgi:hypothetical protein
MLTANLKFIFKNLLGFFLFAIFYFKNRITSDCYSRGKGHPLLKTNVPIKHKQISFMSNGGKFKLDSVPNSLLFSTPLSPGFHLNA